MATPICPYGKPRPEVSANEGFYLKPNQVYYKDYFAERPLTDDVALNTQIIQEHGGIVYGHYANVTGNRRSSSLQSFGTSSSIDMHTRGNNEKYGYKPSALVENAIEENNFRSYAPAQSSLKEFANRFKRPSDLTIEAQLENRRQNGVVGMKKFSAASSNNKLVGGGFIKNSSKVSKDEQEVLAQFRENKKKIIPRQEEDFEDVESISFEEI